MHNVEIPQWVRDRVMAARGKLHAFDTLDPATTALLVVDLQNGFMMDGVGHSVSPSARDIVPNVNRIAETVRTCGGTVVWIQNTVTDESLTSWSVMNRDLSTRQRREKRRESMREGSLGHQLWATLDARPTDTYVKKLRFSAFIQGSSDLEAILRARNIDTVIVTGTATGVCCESTARDAMMRNFKTIMITDANAAQTDAEHNGALIAFYRNFGDIMSTDEVIGYMTHNASTLNPKREKASAGA